MNLHGLIWKEMRQRPAPTVTALLAVALGVSAFVAVQSVAGSSEAEVSQQMQQLGANVLVLPRDVSLQDYYSADMHGRTLPEEYVTRIAIARQVGVEELAPKLCVATTFRNQSLVLTGILPRTEFLRKASWQSVHLMFETMEPASIGTAHEGCKGHTSRMAIDEDDPALAYAQTRVVHDLRDDDLLVGCDVAERHGLQVGQSVSLYGERFTIAGILPPTGRVDDGRVFAHLHTVQRLTDSGAVVNVIEVMACCEEAAGGLIAELNELLPETRVVTISQIVSTQVTINRLMQRLSYVLFGILMVAGGAGIAGVMFSNVMERQRELGTLMALGATPGLLSRMILTKAALLGLAGGIVGLGIGLLTALLVGPWFLNMAIAPSYGAAGLGLAAALVVAILASYFPARRAAGLDPCVCFQQL